jgi:hypothetical protein
MTSLWEIDLQGPLFLVLRSAAAVGGAIVGWFLAGPVVRLLGRLAFHRPLPRSAMLFGRIAGAGLLACLIFYYLPLGFGGGPGWGPGPGGMPGAGGGLATHKSPGSQAAPEKAPKKTAPKETAPQREILSIELLGGDRYKGDGRFYLLHRREPAVTLKDVEKYFQEHRGQLEVRIILTPESVGESHGAVERLRALADKYDLPNTKIKTVAE